MKFLFAVIAVCITSLLWSQKDLSNSSGNNNISSKQPLGQKDSTVIFNPKYSDYKYWTENQTIQTFDTANTIENYWIYRNFNNKINFEKIQSTTIGNFLNPVLYEVEDVGLRLLPYTKSDFHVSENDTKYYNVKTPMTEFIYHNGQKEGHILNTTFTHNIHSRWNYALHYRGLKSLGKYLNNLTSKNNFVVTTNYITKDERYILLAHFYNENNDNEENGGIRNDSDFENGLSQLRNRQRIITRLEDATSTYDYRRYYLKQEYGLVKKLKEDSTAYFPIALRNKFMYESMEYVYKDTSKDTLYTSSYNTISPLLYATIDRRSGKRNKNFHQFLSAVFQLKNTLVIEAGLKYQNFKFYYPSELTVGSLYIPQEITDNRLGFAGNLAFNWKKNLQWRTEAEFMSGDYFKSTYFFKNYLQFKPLENYSVDGFLNFYSRTPSLQLLTNQSFYKNFNFNSTNFENENILHLGGKISSESYKASLSAQFFGIDNYRYIASDYLPKTSEETVSIFQLRGDYRFSYRKFHVDAILAYQKVSSGKEVLPLPDFVGNVAFYYQSSVFRNAANLQTGLSISYFSQFTSREFFPVLNEFMLSTQDKEIGNYPVMNIFANLKVKTMRIYIEAQHFNSSFTGYNYYAVPKYPFMDFRLNIGLVWLILT